jgi:hypothetical protein
MVNMNKKAEYDKGIRLLIKLQGDYLLGITKSIHYP